MLALSGDGAEPGLRGRDLSPVVADAVSPERERAARSPIDLGPVLEHAAPAPRVRDAVHFTYDDHQAGTAMQEAPGQPNRIRAIRTESEKFALYFDPSGEKQSEYEMYDLDRDPDEVENLLDVRTGEPRSAAARSRKADLAEWLEGTMQEAGTAEGVPAP
jgi:hypothetical protein